MSFYDWFFLEKGRTIEGMFSFAHLFSVTVALAVAVVLAVFLGKRTRFAPKRQRLVLAVSAASIVLVQIAKIAFLAAESDDSLIGVLIGNAPLYLCDMAIFMIPLAAVTPRGRFHDCCVDFMAVWGMLMGTMGTYFAGNIYGSHAAFSFLAVVSLLNHAISGFTAVYLFAAKACRMEKRNVPITIGILVVIMTFVLVLDYVDGHNFMFFFTGDGTPYDTIKSLLGGRLIPYQISVYVCQCGYMAAFYAVYYLIVERILHKKSDRRSGPADSGVRDS